MNIISFGWTAPAIVVKVKRVTRRDWPDHYARQFRCGEAYQAYDRSPRVGGQKLFTIRLLELYKERACDVPEEDWELEGFAFLEQAGITLKGRTPREVWQGWKESVRPLWVARFDYDVLPLLSWADSQQPVNCPL